MLLVDLMHEFELGVWRGLFIHLLRMLKSVNKDLVRELDCRYVPNLMNDSERSLIFSAPSFREVPTFGGDTIRRFSSNVSELKKLAARDFEDLLQVSARICMFNARLAKVSISVLSQFLMGSSQSPTTVPSCDCSSYARIGMPWLNFVCILIKHSIYSTKLLSALAPNFAHSPLKRAAPSIHMN